MSKPWDMKVASWWGRAMPNEMSKAAPILKYIPYIGWLATALGASDAGATAYSDIYEQGKNQGLSSSQARLNAVKPTIGSVLGTLSSGSDPGQYGSSGNRLKNNWSNYLGDIGSLYGGYNSGSAGGMGGSLLNIYNRTQGSTYGTDIYTGRGQSEHTPAWEGYARGGLSLFDTGKGLYGNIKSGNTTGSVQSGQKMYGSIGSLLGNSQGTGKSSFDIGSLLGGSKLSQNSSATSPMSLGSGIGGYSLSGQGTPSTLMNYISLLKKDQEKKRQEEQQKKVLEESMKMALSNYLDKFNSQNSMYQSPSMSMYGQPLLMNYGGF